MSTPTPLALHEFRMYAPAQINGAATHAFLDTGATSVNLTPAAAAAFERTGTTGMRGAFSEQAVDLVSVNELAFLGETFANQTAHVAERDPDEAPFAVGALIGAPVLFSKPIAFDFRQFKVGFVEAPSQADAVEQPIQLAHGLAFLSMQLAGNAITAFFDTGAGMSTFNAARLGMLGERAVQFDSLEVGDMNNTQRQGIPVYHCADLTCGNVNLGACEFLAIDLSGIEDALGMPVHLILGANTLIRSGKVWTVDAARQTLCIG